MSVVWKFPIIFIAEQEILLPLGIQILSVQFQREFCMWGVVDPKEERRTLRKLYVVGTGNELPTGNIEHIGTVQLDSYVWHFFIERAS